MTGKAQVDGADVVRLVALAALWGDSFIFMRVLAPALGPLFTATSRVFIAGIVMVGCARVAGCLLVLAGTGFASRRTSSR